MGKGDKKSRRGKIHIKSFGTRRPRKKGNTVPGAVVPKVKAEEPVKPVERTPKKVVKEEPAAPVAEVATEVKKTVRKTTKKTKEEPSAE